jgi:TMEM175 potassium channel family protein
VEKSRLEAFSDGVFAIAITLLVIVFLDQDIGEHDLGHELLELWPYYLAYVLTFVSIGIIWVNHHALFGMIEYADRTLLYLNVALLVPVVFLPFPTELLAKFVRTDEGRAAALLYGCTMVLMALIFNAIWHYAARHRRLLRADVEAKEIGGISRSYALGPLMYGAATLAALASPELSAVLYGVVAAVYISTSLWGRRAGEA